MILQDSYGYESFISYKDFICSNQKFYIVINDEEIPLNFIEEISNNNFIYIEKNEHGNNQEKEQVSIPPKSLVSFQSYKPHELVLK